MSQRELRDVLMVSQSTISRLLDAKIGDVRRHCSVLDRWEREAGGLVKLEAALTSLSHAARQDPAMARLLIQLCRLMQNA